MYKSIGGRRSKVQRRRISKQQRRNRPEETGETVDPDWVMTRTRASDPTHVPLLTSEEKRDLMLYSNLENLPETASSRRHLSDGANGGRRRGRRISRRRISRRR